MARRAYLSAMGEIPDHPDIIVIGAGAAGLAAVQCLSRARVSFAVVEARARPGGRALTSNAGGFPLDLGCGWLHSAATNPLAGEAARLGFEIDRSPPPWQKECDARAFPLADQRDFRRAWAQFYQRLEDAAKAGVDRPARECLEPGNRWNAMLDAGSTYVNGVELDGLSVIDFGFYRDSGVNWRVPAGMGAMIARLADAMPIAYDCAATRLDHSGSRLRIETTRGAFTARAAIVTLSTNLIASEALRFSPAAPDKLQAAARLPLGVADKLFLAVENPDDLPVDGRLYGARDSVAMASYHLRPFGRPLIEAYFGGRFARDLENAGARAFADYAIADIAGVLGADMRRRLSLLACSGWARDAFALGSYSHALPGHAGERAMLAAPLEDRIFFAGEATSKHDFSTAHGAWRSGVQAAAEALAPTQDIRTPPRS